MMATSKTKLVEMRKTARAKETAMRLGSDIQLTEKEQKVNGIIMSAKHGEITHCMEHGNFPPALHFSKSKSMIDRSKVYTILTHMPKGALLHVHSSTLLPVDWLVKLTYRPDCYMCTLPDGIVRFVFAASPISPDQQSKNLFMGRTIIPDCDWRSVAAERAASDDVIAFDAKLAQIMTITGLEKGNRSHSEIWAKFISTFAPRTDLIAFAPHFKEFLAKSMDEVLKDNIQYFELRFMLLKIYNLDGSVNTDEWVANTIKLISNQFTKTHPEFYGMRIIIESARIHTKDKIREDIECARKLMTLAPDLYIGYDLVAREETGYTLDYYMDELQYGAQLNIPYFFHAGETAWKDSQVDNNILDAILLNTKRIGHGFALGKHPVAKALLKERDICLEVNPISNQVLDFVSDLRNHPMVPLLAENYPIVISSDDPGTWGSAPLSHDFYAAFMGMAGGDDDLRFLRKLALNSIKYSGLPEVEKEQLRCLWKTQWDNFVETILTIY